MISKFMFSKQIKELTSCIEQFKQYRQMSKDQARMQSSFQPIYQQLIVNLQEQEFTNKKLINLSDKIEKKVLYYLSNEEQQQVYKHLSNIYYNNIEISNPKQLAITIQYLGNINQIISVIFNTKLSQEELYYTIKALNIRNEWSNVEQKYIEKVKQRLDEILSDEIELDYGLFNQLIIASQSINIQSTIRRIFKLQKLSNILQMADPITITHLDIIIRIVGDSYLSITNWQLYQEQILQLPLTTLAQQQFVYDHLNRYYQLNKEFKELLSHPGLSKQRQSNIIINGILGKMEQSLDNLNSLNISNDLQHCSLNEFCTLNRQLFLIKYDKHNDIFVNDYLTTLFHELIFFHKNNNYQNSDKLDQYIKILSSLDGFYELKLQKKQINPIKEIYSKIEEEVFNIVCQNYFEIELDGDQDPFAIDLLKQNKIKAGKWKEEEDQIKIKISTEAAINHTYQLYTITKLYSNNFKGRIYFYYAILKSMIVGLKEIAFTQQCDIIYYLTKIDKTYMLDGNQFQIDYSQLQNLKGSEQLKCAIQLLFYNEITFNIEKSIISNLITIIHENLELLTSLSNELQATFFLAYKIMQIEFPSIQTKALPAQLSELFENHWLYLQHEKESIVSDTKKYMDKEGYHYTHLQQVDIWKFFFVFEENKTVILCLSKRFYLGSTNLNLIEVSILKRVLRLLDYKLRILDRHEYTKLGTREAKNTYIYEKLKHLNREPKKPKKLYFNY